MLDFSFSRSTPLVLQTEAAECGLACLAMIAGHHGHRIDLATLRGRHAVSLKGSTLADLMRLAGNLSLAPRPPTTVGADQSACTHQLCRTTSRSMRAKESGLRPGGVRIAHTGANCAQC